MCRPDLQFAADNCRRAVGLLALMLMIVPSVHGAGEPENRNGLSLHGEFAIGKEGRLILIPVELDGQVYRFLLDTGACRSGFDTSLRDALGEQQGTQWLQTPAGRKRVPTYDWPEATFKGQSLKRDRPVICLDFADLRQGSSEQIVGVIGMDVMRDCRLQINFDRGQARFLKSLPARREELGVRIPIEFSVDGAPHVVGVIAENVSERFLIDTGAQGNSLRSELFDQLLEQNLVEMGGAFTNATVGGEVQGNRGRLLKLSVGSDTQERLRVARINLSSLGLRYLSRFQVTFDFPGSAVYLRKGEHYAKSEPRATSGLTLGWIDGQVVVGHVKDGGPAATAGMRSNDILVQVNGKSTSDYDHFSLRQLLTSEAGRKVSVRFRRAEREFDAELTLHQE